MGLGDSPKEDEVVQIWLTTDLLFPGLHVPAKEERNNVSTRVPRRQLDKKGMKQLLWEEL